MNPGLVVKLRPLGPWRSGPDSGLRNRVDAVYHSDSLYSAVTWAMHSLGALDAWLDATARNSEGAAVRLASCYPFQDDVGYVIPPRTLWPPTGGAPVSAPRVRWKSARFIPLSLIQPLLAGQVLDDNGWTLDAASECLVPAGKPGPFRTAVRTNAAVDRLTGTTDRHATACIEFYPGAGLWTVVSFADESAQGEWGDRVKGAFRLLADTGFGGERSRGWGRCEQPEFIDGELPDMILGAPASENVTGYWLLSLFSPAAEDSVDWQRGNYGVVARAGRIQGQGRSGDLKKQVNMIAEGSVLVASAEPKGTAPDVSPEGYPHPIFRCGFALQVPLTSSLPVRSGGQTAAPVEAAVETPVAPPVEPATEAQAEDRSADEPPAEEASTVEVPPPAAEAVTQAQAEDRSADEEAESVEPPVATVAEPATEAQAEDRSADEPAAAEEPAKPEEPAQ